MFDEDKDGQWLAISEDLKIIGRGFTPDRAYTKGVCAGCNNPWIINRKGTRTLNNQEVRKLKLKKLNEGS